MSTTHETHKTINVQKNRIIIKLLYENAHNNTTQLMIEQ